MTLMKNLKLTSVVLGLFLLNSSLFGQVPYEKVTLSVTQSKVLKQNKSYKTGTSTVSLGDYIWFDYNQNGIQDLGEQGLYNITVSLYNSADCSGQVIAETKSSDIGYYQFENISLSTDKYCIAIEYPSYWTKTVDNKGSDAFDSELTLGSSTLGKIENILLSSNQSLDAGLHHSDKQCQTPKLEVGLLGTYDKTQTWSKRVMLDVKFNNLVASGFCHEYHDGGPATGEKYSVHLKDRRGFTAQQRDFLSRTFGFMSDEEVKNLLVETFDKHEKHYWFNLLSVTFVWYYSDWKQDFSTLEEFVDTRSQFSVLTASEKEHLKEIAKIILNKIEGINGAKQYPSMTVYYLWNEDNDAHQDIIVPQTSLVPDREACTQKPETFMKAKLGDYVWLDSNHNGQQDSGESGLSGIDVQLFDTENKSIASIHTDASGHYQFSNLLYGNYYLKFSVPNGYTVSPKDKGIGVSDSDANVNGRTDIFNLESVENQSFDMGLYPTPITLGNRVWEDVNKNGLQDNSEKNNNIPNVKVKLFSQNGQFLFSTLTNARGEYQFENLLAGKYFIQFEIPENYKVTSLNTGSNDSIDSDANTAGKTELFTLVAGLDNRSIDMGLYQKTAKVGDRVWYDSNKNAVQDTGENGVADVEVKLYRVGESTAVARTKTSSTGIYIFDDVLPDEYYIVFTVPAGYTITKAHKINDNKKDSDANEEGRTDNFILESGTENSSIDMGVYQNVVSIGDRVWLDTNHNGLQDVGESGIRDINVTVHSATSDFKKSMLTDENGNYIFSHLSAGEYSLEFSDIPYGYLLTEQNINNNAEDARDSDVFVNADKKSVTEVTLLTPSENDLSWDMGIYKTVCLPGKSVLGNLVWNDFNKNGIQDIGERGVFNVKVTLYNNDTDENISSTVTDKNGLYEFAHINPSFNYYVQFRVPSGYKVSPQDQDEESIDSDADSTGRTDVVSLVADTIYSNLDMGIYHEGSTIGDRVWFDEKDGLSNGIQDEGEQGVFDVKVTLYNANNKEINSTRTNASGAYHFTNLSKGNYSVQFSELPEGYIFTVQDQGADEERDSDVKIDGKSFVFSVNGSQNITHLDAGIKKSRKGISAGDLKRGITGKTVTIDVLANDVSGSFNFDPTTVKITSTPEGGILSDNGKKLIVPTEGVWSVNPTIGEITFTPNEGYIGDPTSITYSVKDTQGNETNSDVKIDYPPVAKDDLVNAEVGKEVVVYVLDNDTNTSSPLDKTTIRIINPSNDDAVEILSVTGEGTWSTNTDGSIHFLPDNGFIDNPTAIEYIVQEELGDVSNRASVTIIYPDAVDDTFIVPPEHSAEIVVDVSENDSNNTNSSELTIGCSQTGVRILTVQGEGIWQVNAEGSITFVTENGFIAEPTDIQYTVGLLSGGRSNCATVDIRYALLAVNDRNIINVGAVTLIDVLNNDLGNINASTLVLVIPENAPNGTTLEDNGHTLRVPTEGVWSVLPNNIVSFTSVEGFIGVPTPINYHVENSDGVQSNIASITLVDGAVSGIAIIANDDIGQAHGNADPIVIDVLANDIGDSNGSTVLLVDDNGDLVERIVLDGEGVWTVDDANRVVFTPVIPFIGTPTSRRYVVRDASGILSNQANISFQGKCVCKAYESSIPVMNSMSELIMFLLTLFVAMFYLRENEALRTL